MRDVAPGTSQAFSFIVLGFGNQGFNYDIESTAQSKQDYLSQVADEAEAAREFMLTNTNVLQIITTNGLGVVTTNTVTLPPDVTTAMSDSNLWAVSFAQWLVPSGLLDSNDVVSLPSLQAETIPSDSVSIPNGPNPSPMDLASCLQQALETLANNLQTAYNNYVIALGACALVCIIYKAGCIRCLALATAIYYNQKAGAEKNYDIQVKFCQQNNCRACPVNPGDPNEMQGPLGYSTAAFVGSQVPWQYTVYFENETNALAFARQIVITNVLNPSFDIRTFRVSEIAFGNVTIKVPANRSFYQTRVAAPSPNPTNVVVDVTAGVDVQHSTVFWTLNAIDLNTGQLVENALGGILPPDTTNHIGEGHVSYVIQPAAGVPTGTVITNDASVVFDNNDPINTNPTTNTVDAVPPTSTVLTLPSAVLTTNFSVSWFGTDDPNASGVASYDVYFSEGGGPWQVWQSGVTQTSATFSGQPGDTSYFYSVAHDNAGNVEASPSIYQAMTLVSTNQPPNCAANRGPDNHRRGHPRVDECRVRAGRPRDAQL